MVYDLWFSPQYFTSVFRVVFDLLSAYCQLTAGLLNYLLFNDFPMTAFIRSDTADDAFCLHLFQYLFYCRMTDLQCGFQLNNAYSGIIGDLF